MAHSSKMRWAQAEALVANSAQTTLRSLLDAEAIYRDLLEAYNFAGGTDQLFADLCFKDVIELEIRVPAVANAEEVSMVTDLRLAITALHDLYQALNNVSITAEDRSSQLRRLS